MKISLLQMDLKWGAPAANRATAASLIDANPGSDIYILPEMFSTGFATKPEGIAEKDGGSLDWMKAKAKQTGAAVCGSVATEDGGKFYNRFFFVKPDGSVAHYDKRHLFTYSGEDKRYTRGEEKTVVEWEGFHIMPLVCYDLRFPTWSRNKAVTNAHGGKDYLYDLIIYVASWPTSRQTAWEALLRARAIENQCWVAGVNRVGSDPANTYSGGSKLIDPWGNIITAAGPGKEMAATADIDIDDLKMFRKDFPVLEDAD